MEFAPYTVYAAITVTLTALGILITVDWRASLALLALQYLSVFVLVAVEWSLTMAVTVLVAGWMTVVVLGIAMLNTPEGKPGPVEKVRVSTTESSPVGEHDRIGINRPLYVLAAVLVGFAALTQVLRVSSWIPEIGIFQVWGGLILAGMGLLKVAYFKQPLQAMLGLLTVLAGFEIIFAAMDATPLTAGMLAGVTLGLALTGAYLLIAPLIGKP